MTAPGAGQLEVLFLAGELAPWKRGGIATVVRDLANALVDQADIRIALLGTMPSGEQLPVTVYRPGIEDLSVHVTSLPQPFRRVWLQIGYLWNFLSWIVRTRGSPRVVHAHLLPGFRLFCVLVLVVALRVPYVQTVYDWPPLEIPWYRKWRIGFWLHWALAQTLLGAPQAVVVNSRFIGDLVTAKWPHHKVRIVPNALGMPKRFLALKAPPPNAVPTVLFWGELYPKKGPELLVGAVQLVRTRTPDLAFSVVMAGDGPDRKLLEQLIHEKGLQATIELRGAVSFEELLSLLEAAALVVLPSAYEGFGIAILEAMAAGRPVITTARGGATDIIRSSEEGLLVAHDVEAYADAMIGLLRAPERRSRIGSGARLRAKMFCWGSIASQVRTIYAGAAGKR